MAKDPREYGYEGDMAISQLKSIVANAEKLMSMLKPESDLPEWVQLKITLAQDYILTARDYMESENMNEAKTFVYDKPNAQLVKMYDKKPTNDLKGMHSRWSKDHEQKNSNPSRSEDLMAVHHVLKKRGENMPNLPKHKNLGMMRMHENMGEACWSGYTAIGMKMKNGKEVPNCVPSSEAVTTDKPPFAGPFKKIDPAKQPARSRLKTLTKNARETIAKSSTKKSK
jgi:hypothetical protein